MYDAKESGLRESFELEKISFVAALPKDPRVFCFVSVNDTVLPHVHKCHVFKSETKVCEMLESVSLSLTCCLGSQSVRIAETMGRCFTLALEQRRKSTPPRHQLRTPAVIAQPRLQTRAMPASLEAVFSSIRNYAMDTMLATGDDLTFLNAAFDDVRSGLPSVP